MYTGEDFVTNILLVVTRRRGLCQALSRRRHSSFRSALLTRPIVLDGYPALAFKSSPALQNVKGETCTRFALRFVRRRGLEPPYPCECYHLKVVRLPVSPPAHILLTLTLYVKSHRISSLKRKKQDIFLHLFSAAKSYSADAASSFSGDASS